MTEEELYATHISLSREEFPVVMAALRAAAEQSTCPVEKDLLKRVDLRMTRRRPRPWTEADSPSAPTDAAEEEILRSPCLTMPEWGGF